MPSLQGAIEQVQKDPGFANASPDLQFEYLDKHVLPAVDSGYAKANPEERKAYVNKFVLPALKPQTDWGTGAQDFLNSAINTGSAGVIDLPVKDPGGAGAQAGAFAGPAVGTLGAAALAPETGGASLAIPAAYMGAVGFGNNARQQQNQTGKVNYAQAAGVGAINAGLGLLPGARAGAGALERVLTNSGIQGAGSAGADYLQNAVNQGTATPQINPQELIRSGLIGAGLGAGASALHAGVQSIKPQEMQRPIGMGQIPREAPAVPPEALQQAQALQEQAQQAAIKAKVQEEADKITQYHANLRAVGIRDNARMKRLAEDAVFHKNELQKAISQRALEQLSVTKKVTGKIVKDSSNQAPQNNTLVGHIDQSVSNAIGSPVGEIHLDKGTAAYGEVHIAKDPKKLANFKKAGFDTIRGFVEKVGREYNQVWKQDNGKILIVKANGKAHVGVIELRPEKGGYYSVVSSYIANKSSLPKEGRVLAWERSETLTTQTGSPEPHLVSPAEKQPGQQETGARSQANTLKTSISKNELKAPSGSKPEYHLEAQDQKPMRGMSASEASKNPQFQAAAQKLEPQQQANLKTLMASAKANKKTLQKFYTAIGTAKRTGFEQELYTPKGFSVSKAGDILVHGYNEHAQFSTRRLDQFNEAIQPTKHEGYNGLYHSPERSPGKFDPQDAIYEKVMNPLLKAEALNKRIDVVDWDNAADRYMEVLNELSDNQNIDQLKKATDKLPEKIKNEVCKRLGLI